MWPADDPFNQYWLDNPITNVWPQLHIGCDELLRQDLSRYKLGLIVSLVELPLSQPELPVPRHIVLPIKDSPLKPDVKNLLTDFEIISVLIDDIILKGFNVLVHCNCGVSRSPALVTYYLMTRHSLPMDVVLMDMRSKRTCVNPSAYMLSALRSVSPRYEHVFSLAPSRSTR